ncbi:MAG: hypothetical protein LBQ79_12340 [Deltaproteobacteria bacterium]|jgi:hypothetical protein|nr:hypothetical protein [Deltaproteobacteria bacterium]
MTAFELDVLDALLGSRLSGAVLEELLPDRDLLGSAAARRPGPGGDDRGYAGALLAAWAESLSRNWKCPRPEDPPPGRDTRLRILAYHVSGLARGADPVLFPDARAAATALGGDPLDVPPLERPWRSAFHLLAARDLISEAAGALSAAFALPQGPVAPDPASAPGAAGAREEAAAGTAACRPGGTEENLERLMRRLRDSDLLEDGTARSFMPEDCGPAAEAARLALALRRLHESVNAELAELRGSLASGGVPPESWPGPETCTEEPPLPDGVSGWAGAARHAAPPAPAGGPPVSGEDAEGRPDAPVDVRDVTDAGWSDAGRETDWTRTGRETDWTQTAGESDWTQTGRETDWTRTAGESDRTRTDRETDWTQTGRETDWAAAGAAAKALDRARGTLAGLRLWGAADADLHDSVAAELDGLARDMEIMFPRRGRGAPAPGGDAGKAAGRIQAAAEAVTERLELRNPASLERAAERLERLPGDRLALLPGGPGERVLELLGNGDHFAAMEALVLLEEALETGNRLPAPGGPPLRPAAAEFHEGLRSRPEAEGHGRRDSSGEPLPPASDPRLLELWSFLEAARGLDDPGEGPGDRPGAGGKAGFPGSPGNAAGPVPGGAARGRGAGVRSGEPDSAAGTAAVGLLMRLGFFFGTSSPYLGERISYGGPFTWTGLTLDEASLESRLPDWGSSAGGRHTIVFGWGSPGPEDIARMARTAMDAPGRGGGPVTVVTFGPLGREGRLELMRLCRRDGICPLVVDLDLARFLSARCPGIGGRDRALTAAGLAGWARPPYAPDAAGSVPEEMFFGREAEMEMLTDPDGPSLVCGPRQSGKSAMLVRLARTRSRPEQGSYVLYRHAGGAQTFEEAVCGALAHAGLAPEGLDCGCLADQIGRLLPADARGPYRRITVIVDGCDALLDAERSRGYTGLEPFREAAEAAGGRFRLILCGGLPVLRLSRMPGAPFGGRPPLALGPLAGEDAWRLAALPLAAMGMELSPPSAAVRLLETSGSQPGLLQLCLLETTGHARAVHGEDGVPPMGISPGDLETVFRRPQLQRRLRERLEWTLDEDPRWRAAAYAMALAGLARRRRGGGGPGAGDGSPPARPSSFPAPAGRDWERGPRGEGLRALEILDVLARSWPASFRGAGPDAAESLLGEMTSFGILRRSRDRLSFAIPDMLGLLMAHGEVEEEMARYAEEPAPSVPPAPALRRALPPPHAPLPSPLPFWQEAALAAPGTSAWILAGSEALGARRVRAALESLPGNPGPGGAGERAPGGAPEGAGDGPRRAASGLSARGIALTDTADPARFRNRFLETLDGRDSHSGPGGPPRPRPVGVMRPASFRDLEALSSAGGGGTKVFFLERWNAAAAAFLLEAAGLAPDRAFRLACRLMESTGGWDCLLAPELARLSNPEEALGAAEDLEAGGGPPRFTPPPPGFRDMAGIPDPAPLYRAADSVLSETGAMPFTEAGFARLLAERGPFRDGPGNLGNREDRGPGTAAGEPGPGPDGGLGESRGGREESPGGREESSGGRPGEAPEPACPLSPFDVLRRLTVIVPLPAEDYAGLNACRDAGTGGRGGDREAPADGARAGAPAFTADRHYLAALAAEAGGGGGS